MWQQAQAEKTQKEGKARPASGRAVRRLTGTSVNHQEAAKHHDALCLALKDPVCCPFTESTAFEERHWLFKVWRCDRDTSVEI